MAFMHRQDTLKFQSVAENAAKTAGNYLLGRLGNAKITEKNPGDLVTDADLASQQLIFDELSRHFPNHGLMGEEAAANSNWSQGFCWIVDPIDGTTNFVHGLPSFSISIALLFDGIPLVGVVYDPMLKECFSAISGQGSFLNREPIRPSLAEELRSSLIVCSFPGRVTSDTAELIRFNRVVQKTTMRRLGSAALNLCYVGCGRLDGYWASTLSLWDFAAGMLIAEEAGACLFNLDGAPFSYTQNDFCITSTKRLNAELLPLLKI